MNKWFPEAGGIKLKFTGLLDVGEIKGHKESHAVNMVRETLTGRDNKVHR